MTSRIISQITPFSSGLIICRRQCSVSYRTRVLHRDSRDTPAGWEIAEVRCFHMSPLITLQAGVWFWVTDEGTRPRSPGSLFTSWVSLRCRKTGGVFIPSSWIMNLSRDLDILLIVHAGRVLLKCGFTPSPKRPSR